MRSMLKNLTLTLIVILFSTGLFAQAQKSVSTEDALIQKSKEKTEYLKKQLELTENQEVSVSELTQRMTFKSSTGTQNQTELDAYYNEEMSRILTDQQMQKYLSLPNNNGINENKASQAEDEKAKMVPKN